MKIVRVLSNPIQEYQGDAVYTTVDSITLMLNGSVEFSVKGINNWSMFEIVGDINKTEQQITQETLDLVILALLDI